MVHICVKLFVPISLLVLISAAGPSVAGMDRTGVIADCNENGVADAKDISGGRSTDCNSDGVPDECGLIPGCVLDDGASGRLYASDGSPLDRFGASVVLLPGLALIGAPRDACGAGSSCGAVYVFEKADGGWLEVDRVTAGVRDNGDRFGEAIDSDGTWLAVGSPYSDCDVGQDCGSVDLFEHVDGTWTYRQTVHDPTPEPSTRFGHSLQVEGDFLAVGYPRKSCKSGVACGSVFLYGLSDGKWQYASELISSDPESSDRFGFDLDLFGDTLVVSAPFEHCGSVFDCGALHVFERDSGTWGHVIRLVAEQPDSFAALGRSVAVHGEVIVAGAYRASCVVGDDCGTATVFRRGESGWAFEQTLLAHDPTEFEQFGYSVAIEPDHIVAGARLEDVEYEMDAGAVYSFRFDGKAWQPGLRFSSSEAAQSALTGYSVGVLHGLVLAGAEGDHVAGTVDTGAAYFFDARYPDCDCNGEPDVCDVSGGATDCNGNLVPDSCELPDRDCNSNGIVDDCDPDCNGNHVADDCEKSEDCNGNGILDDCEEDCNGNGIPNDCDLVSDCNSDGVPDECGVPSTCVTSEVQKFTPPEAEGSDYFGASLGMLGDLMMVGSPHDDCPNNGGNNCGSAYVYKYSGRWQLQQKLLAPNGYQGDEFGESIRISSGTEVFIGASGTDCDAGSRCGSVYVFRKGETGWSFDQELHAPEQEQGDRFGTRISVWGDTLVVGMPNGSCFDGVDRCGIVHLFARTGDTWTYSDSFRADDTVEDDFFGSVSLSGRVLAVGASGDDADQINVAGSVYVYRRMGDRWIPEARLTMPTPLWSTGFGGGVITDGTRIYAVAPGENCPGAFDCGAVYIYRHEPGGWVFEQRLASDDPVHFDRFGSTLAVDGGRLVAGMSGKDCETGDNCGTAFVFRRDGNTWHKESQLVSLVPDENDYFGGGGISMDSGMIAIGGVIANSREGVVGTGAVYTFFNDDCNCNGMGDVCDGGDFDGSDEVDLSDWAVMTSCVGGPAELADGCCRFFDLDQNHFVGLRDVSRMFTAFGE